MIAELREVAGPTGLVPLWILLGISAAERFDATAFGVLGPEIRSAFHLTNSEYLSISGIALILPLFLAVPIGALGDRRDRVGLARWGALAWGLTCIGTGLSPAIAIFVLFRMAGGIGQTVNQPVHPSLLADYSPAEALAPTFTFYNFAPGAIALIAGPLAGGISSFAGWRLTFIVLALPTFALVVLTNRLKEPPR